MKALMRYPGAKWGLMRRIAPYTKSGRRTESLWLNEAADQHAKLVQLPARFPLDKCDNPHYT
jgi:hypothetical protein